MKHFKWHGTTGPPYYGNHFVFYVSQPLPSPWNEIAPFSSVARKFKPHRREVLPLFSSLQGKLPKDTRARI